MNVGVLFLAAGSGRRFGGEIPKQYRQVAGRSLLLHTLEHLAAEPRIRVVQPVIAENDARFSECLGEHRFGFQMLEPVTGGAERSISMQRGLAAMPEAIDMVAVHDAARPVPSASLLADVFDMAEKHGAAVPGVPVHDTIKRMGANRRVLETPPRDSLVAVQTPQVARRDWFVEALKKEQERLHQHTDDASVLEAAGFPVYVSHGDVMNRKITTPADMEWLEAVLQGRQGGCL